MHMFSFLFFKKIILLDALNLKEKNRQYCNYGCADIHLFNYSVNLGILLFRVFHEEGMILLHRITEWIELE